VRVLHLLNELRPSGAEVMLRDSGPLWAARGVEADVLATAPAVGSFAPALEGAGYGVHHLPATAYVPHLRALRQLLRRDRYDLLHVHTERASFSYGMVGASAPGVGVVRTVHNVFAFDGALRARRTAQRTAFRLAGGRTIAIADSVASNERTRFRNPTVRVPNWVDTARFHPPSADERAAARTALGLDREGTRTIVVSVGNCNTTKNHAAVITALGDLDDPGWLYVHAGEEDAKRTERRLAETLGVGDRCRFLGHVTDVPALLRAADVYVMPSHYEGLGNAALEALATGVPCVLADVTGLRDLRATVPEGVTWVSPTPAGVREGLERTQGAAGALDADGRARLHAAVERHHGVAAGVEGYLAVYRDALR
jgi:glycosyltransferase involved in cell wall biosynthesis